MANQTTKPREKEIKKSGKGTSGKRSNLE